MEGGFLLIQIKIYQPKLIFIWFPTSFVNVSRKHSICAMIEIFEKKKKKE